MRSRILLVTTVLVAAISANASPLVNLGTAGSFSLLGGTISNTGTSAVTGNVGVQNAAGTITGFNPTGTIVGGSAITPGTTSANNAYTDFVSAFDMASLLASTQSFTDLTVSRTFLGNNVYTFTLADISTTTGIQLTFDAQNDPNQVFVIRTNGAFTANGALTFSLQNQARASNIFWIIGTIGTISVGSSGPITFEGNILAGESFTMSAATGGSGELAGTIHGSVYAQTALTLAGTTNVTGYNSDASAEVPEPSSGAFVGLGGLFSLWAWRKTRASR